MLSREQSEKVIERAIELASGKADGIEVAITGSDIATSRFANNEMTQNQAPSSYEISVRVLSGDRQIRISSDDVSSSGIKRLVDTALAKVQLAAPDGDLPPLYSPGDDRSEKSSSPEVVPESNSVSRMSPSARSKAVASIIRIAEANDLNGSGIVSSGSKFISMGNSRGLLRHHSESHFECSVTMTGQDSSGWAKAQGPNLEFVDAGALARSAAWKAVNSKDPGEIQPGRYTVVLEHSAALDLLGYLLWDFSGTSHVDKRSCLLDRLGQAVFGDNVNIRDDVYHAQQSGACFDGDGQPRQSVSLVEKGVVSGLVYGRRSAGRAGVSPTGHGLPEPSTYGEYPMNPVMEGGDHTDEELIESVDEGVLLSRAWYVREVDPTRKILTGMSRDGTFLIKGGKVVSGLKNMRFNVSLIDLLNSITRLGISRRSAGEETFPAVVPSMVVEDFNFTEVTRF